MNELEPTMKQGVLEKEEVKFLKDVENIYKQEFLNSQTHLKKFYYSLGVLCNELNILREKAGKEEFRQTEFRIFLETHLTDIPIAPAEISYSIRASKTYNIEQIDSFQTWTAVKESLKRSDPEKTPEEIQEKNEKDAAKREKAIKDKKDLTKKKEYRSELKKGYMKKDNAALKELLNQKATILVETIFDEAKSVENKKSMIELTLKLDEIGESFGIPSKRILIKPAEPVIDLSDMEEMLSKKEEDENEKVSAGLDLQGANITA